MMSSSIDIEFFIVSLPTDAAKKFIRPRLQQLDSIILARDARP